MTMHNVFHPDARKWISRVINIGEEAKKLRRLEDEFMEPARDLPDCEYIREEQRKEHEEKQKVAFEAVQLKLFGPKKRGRPKKAKPEEVSPSDEDDLLDEEAEIEGMDMYSDEEEEVPLSKLRAGKGRSQMKLQQASDEMYLFDSEVSSDEENGTEDGDKAKTPGGLNEPGVNVEKAADAIEAEDAEKLGAAGGAPTAAKQQPPPPTGVNPETKEKDEKDFQRFYGYVERHQERVARQSIEEDREEMIAWLMKDNGLNREQAEAEFEELSEATNPQLAFSKSEVIVEDAMIKGSRMPLLAGPIPNEALQAQATLALYTGLSDEPGNFQWRMGHVMDILSTQVEGSLHLLRAEGLETAEQKERNFAPFEAIATLSIYQPVEEVDDMLLEMKTIPEPEFGFEVEILSTQTLNHLCSMFACQADLVYTEDFRNPDHLPATSSEAFALFGDKLAKNVNPWRAIFIHDTIYINFDENDKTMGGKLAAVKSWAERHKKDHGIGEIKFSNRMDKKLSELDIQLGYPYVYVHQGINCEHLFCFTSVRLPRAVENSVFPRYSTIGKYPTKYCVVDNEVLARWAVVDSDRLPQNPMFLCTDCVKDYCFSRKNKRKRVGNFKLYPFFQLIHHID